MGTVIQPHCWMQLRIRFGRFIDLLHVTAKSGVPLLKLHSFIDMFRNAKDFKRHVTNSYTSYDCNVVNCLIVRGFPMYPRIMRANRGNQMYFRMKEPELLRSCQEC
jgi:hypothetical protein